MTPAITLSNLVMRYREREVVSNLSFNVEQGEFFALLGPNGAGKTTTIETLEGYRKPFSGEVRVLGLDPVRQGDMLHRQIGVMLQEGGLYPTTKPKELLNLYSAFYSDPVPVANLIEQVGLADNLNTPVRRLSGGQRQRLSLALALIGKPKLLFLDEPTSGLDPQSRRATWNILTKLSDEGRTIVLTTHYLEEAERLAHRVGIIDSGRLVALDEPAKLVAQSANQFRFRASTPIALDAFPIPLEPLENGWYSIPEAATPERVRLLAEELARQDVLMTDLKAGAGTLEQAFLTLTGKELRD